MTLGVTLMSKFWHFFQRFPMKIANNVFLLGFNDLDLWPLTLTFDLDLWPWPWNQFLVKKKRFAWYWGVSRKQNIDKFSLLAVTRWSNLTLTLTLTLNLTLNTIFSYFQYPSTICDQLGLTWTTDIVPLDIDRTLSETGKMSVFGQNLRPSVTLLKYLLRKAKWKEVLKTTWFLLKNGHRRKYIIFCQNR